MIKPSYKDIGKEGTMAHGLFRVGIVIKDFKVSYGVPRYLVQPLAGSGEVWKNIDNVIIKQ